MADYTKSTRNILLILTVIVIFALLKTLSSLMMPLVLAGFLAVLGLPIVSFLDKKKVPKFIITLLVAGLSLAVVVAIVSLISGTVEELIRDKNFLASQLVRKVNASVAWLGNLIPAFNEQVLQQQFDKLFSPAKIAGFIGSVLGSLSSFGSSYIMFLIYYMILISGATGYQAYIDYVTGPEKDSNASQVLKLTQESITAYMSLKTIISLATGVIAGFICWAFGLQFALFWGFLAFLLNYIPSIGSMLATVIPLLMAIIQYDSIGPIIGLAACLGATQFVIGSVIDPMIMGNKLRLNTITVIFGLIFWGYIWGIPGMLLSVPMMVMVRLLVERSEDFSIISRIMGNPPKSEKSKTSLFNKVVGSEKK